MANMFTVGFARLSRRQIQWTVGLIVAVCLFAWWMIYVPTSALRTSSQPIYVGTGQGVSAIASMLKKDGLIRSSTLFMLYVSAQGWERNLKAGAYIIPKGSALNDIASQVSGGRGVSNDIEVFIPEGFNIWEIDKRFVDAGLITEGQFAAAYKSREGFLFPDTYRFKPESLLGEIAQKMEENGTEKRKELIGHLTAPAQDRILTIASIIEKEAKTESDMHLVSGVIANRLREGMALQIDATVSYGACLRIFNANSKKDCEVHLIAVGNEIKIDSAYNTYTRSGLPPRPISNPGLAAIKAALNPRGDYFYYLSTRDGSEIHFSYTGEEHARKRKQYLGI